MVRGAIAAGSVRVLAAMSAYVTLAVAARVLTKDEFGLVVLLMSIWLVMTMFSLGIGGALTTRVAMAHARDDLTGVRTHVTDALFALAGIGVSIAVAGTVSAVILPWHEWIGGGVSPSTLESCLIVTFVASGMALPAATGFLCLTGMQKFVAAQSSVALGGVLAVAAAVGGAFYWDPSPVVFLVAVLMAPVAVSLCFTGWVLVVVLRDSGSVGGFNGGRFKVLVGASGYYALYNVGNTISLGTSTIIVGSVRGLADAAVFNVAVRLFAPIITVVAASGAQLWPSLTEAISRGDLEWARSRYRSGLMYVTLVSALACIGLVVFGPWLAELWVGPMLVPSRGLIGLTALFSVAVAVTAQASVLLKAVERMRLAAVLSVVAAVASVAASVALTRSFGAPGAVIGATGACLAILLPGQALLARDSLRALQASAAGPQS